MTHHRSRWRRLFQRLLSGLALAVAGMLLAGSAVAVGDPRAPAAPLEALVQQSPYTIAVSTFKADRLQATGQIAVAKSVVASAQLVLDTSAGKVLREEPRAVLEDDVNLARLQVVRADQELVQADRRTDFNRTVASAVGAGRGLTEETATLSSVGFPWAATLTGLGNRLAAHVQAVKDAVVAWEVEQARLAAVEAARVAAAAEAARVAAAQAAEQAAQSSRRSSARATGTVAKATVGAPAAGPVAPAVFNKNVWTSGWQPEIDACRGAVNLTGRYGVAVIAEHWSCGGARFPGAGSTITLSGVFSGTYRVGGVAAVLNASRDGTANIPRGFDLLYQTCINGSNATMSFTALTRVG